MLVNRACRRFHFRHDNLIKGNDDMFKNPVSRRKFLKNAASATAIGTLGSLVANTAYAADTITATEWGGSYIDQMKKIAAKQSDIQVNWHMYSGGAALILPKIKATWPNPGIDLVAGWDLSLQAIAREGWAEPVTAEKVPNLADIPKKLLIKDGSGNVINIPRSISSIFWFYREDNAPFEISKIDDLLDPRLAGKVCFPAPNNNSNLQMVALALHRGGDERNMEPAWDFVKELARSGNIGRVATGDVDVGNSISSGETCISFVSGTGAINMARDFKIKYLTKMDPESGFRTFLFQEGWCVLKGGHADAAFKFANFAINAENNEEFNRSVSGVPVNIKAKTSDGVKPMVFNSEEMDRYVYIPDWTYISEQADAWMKRWEQEIMPLL
ncbi:extracellular solute-binding protein [Mesorhizobium sp. M1A.F.Ca.IN.020.03.2.1]|nr:extracellular solute-binding protein [Mesorhizobium sp. M1A.F.Ca.IN.020.03.2.1]RUV20554.1 extracellular solute-binding protein [Mesorhizobium sp. M1A.F.Ca.IN.022.04.1.1]RWB25736.1 MAG: extracellular solute-binding protein [Mesorhizobium sp.]RWD09639.1 MAG: extracellular solute-binding protein [Mesorhizobium sp.]RWE64287.1 MAG: extracellular solute-binding protein [Mesorhizobium sp.]